MSEPPRDVSAPPSVVHLVSSSTPTSPNLTNVTDTQAHMERDTSRTSPPAADGSDVPALETFNPARPLPAASTATRHGPTDRRFSARYMQDVFEGLENDVMRRGMPHTALDVDDSDTPPTSQQQAEISEEENKQLLALYRRKLRVAFLYPSFGTVILLALILGYSGVTHSEWTTMLIISMLWLFLLGLNYIFYRARVKRLKKLSEDGVLHHLGLIELHNVIMNGVPLREPPAYNPEQHLETLPAYGSDSCPPRRAGSLRSVRSTGMGLSRWWSASTAPTPANTPAEVQQTREVDGALPPDRLSITGTVPPTYAQATGPGDPPPPAAVHRQTDASSAV
ncbi:hypothetical protein DFJ77DRAFT_27863 [Powellomyces hirtus]|nr:hypothetical protein DFJ77DRAFT_27863 [Powellomyces hirtus]